MSLRNTFLAATSLLAVSAIGCGFALASQQNQSAQVPAKHQIQNRAQTTGNAPANEKSVKPLVKEAVTVINNMKKDPHLVKLMKKAKGIYIVPEFGRGAFIVGGRGGAGLAVAHRANGSWSDPAFYDFGGISVGAQAGGSGGAIAFLLMNRTALDAFKSGNKFSLNAGAGLSIVTYSANGQASWGKGDIILWSNTKGAYAGATVSVSDVNWDDGNNKQFYGKKVDPSKIFAGTVTAPQARGKATKLKHALPG